MDRLGFLDVNSMLSHASTEGLDIIDLQAKMLRARFSRQPRILEEMDFMTVGTRLEPDETVAIEGRRRQHFGHAKSLTEKAPSRIASVRRHRNTGVLQSQDPRHSVPPSRSQSGMITDDRIAAQTGPNVQPKEG
jgi:hypothetical protein